MAKLTCVEHCYIVGNALSLKLNSNLGIESGENRGPYFVHITRTLQDKLITMRSLWTRLKPSGQKLLYKYGKQD